MKYLDIYRQSVPCAKWELVKGVEQIPCTGLPQHMLANVTLISYIIKAAENLMLKLILLYSASPLDTDLLDPQVSFTVHTVNT
jgi:hypothetical protein